VGWKRFNWDLHNAGGFWMLAFVAMWALTGAYFAFPQPFVVLAGTFLPMSPPPPAVEAPAQGEKMLPVDQLVAAALAAVPRHRPDWIMLPHHEGEHLSTIYLVPSDPEKVQASTYVHIDPYTAQVLRVDRPAERPLGDRALELFARLHFGTFGWAVKSLWAVIGLTPAALFVTGFLMWWNRVLSKKWRRWRMAAAPEREEDLLRQS
jgi:uncharacterized iron-regulated membrane protein